MIRIDKNNGMPVLAVFFLIPALVMLAAPAYAVEPQGGGNLVFILDASGSMWGQVEGKTKIEIAKEVLTGLIQELPAQVNVGLVAYGHRRRGDCNDVEDLIPLGPVDKNALIKRIKAINPKGKTPITLSIKSTAEKLKTIEEKTSIILVSDGKETCEGDPCALVKELKQSGLKFVMHVIGFDVTDEEQKQLECIAKGGGGKYYTAKTASEFKMAAKEVVEEAQKWGFLKITAMRNDKPFRAAVEVYPSGGKERVVLTSTVIKATEVGTRLLPDVYDVKVIDEEIESRPSVTITGLKIELGKTVKKTVDFSGGNLKIMTLKNEKPFVAKIRVYRPGTNSEVASADTSVHNPETIKLLPGVYDVKVIDLWEMEQEPVVSFTGIRIDPSVTIEKTAEFSEGYLKVSALKNAKPFDASVDVYNPQTNRRVASGDTSSENPMTMKLLPGIYDVKVTDSWGTGESKDFKGIHIGAQETQNIEAAF